MKLSLANYTIEDSAGNKVTLTSRETRLLYNMLHAVFGAKEQPLASSYLPRVQPLQSIENSTPRLTPTAVKRDS